MSSARIQAFSIHVLRYPELCVQWIVDRGRHYSDDRVFLVIQLDLPVNHMGIGGEVALPESKAEDHNVIVTSFVLISRPSAPQQGTGAKEGKEIRFSWSSDYMLGPAYITQVVSGRPGIERHVLKAVGLRFPVKEIRAGKRVVTGRGFSFEEPHELAGIVKRKRAQQDCVNDAEDGGVSADAEGQGDNCHGGEPASFPEVAKTEAKILQNGSHGKLLDGMGRYSPAKIRLAGG